MSCAPPPRGGADCPINAFARLGCEPQCGCCLDYAQEVIDEEHARPRRKDRAAW